MVVSKHSIGWNTRNYIQSINAYLTVQYDRRTELEVLSMPA